MSKPIEKTSRYPDEYRFGRHRFEHWYVDNQLYFITARCRDKFPAFASDRAKAVFWDRFEHYTAQAGFIPWITSLMDNHYHTLGYNRTGEDLRQMMQRLHGSVAKLVNDVLAEDPGLARFSVRSDSDPGLARFSVRSDSDPGLARFSVRSAQTPAQACLAGGRLLPFWRDGRDRDFFDGCLRDPKQCRLAYRYIHTQCRRHSICHDPADYPHTHVALPCEPAITHALAIDAFMPDVPYPRYFRDRPSPGAHAR